MPDQVVEFSEGPFGGAVPVIVAPSPDFRVKVAYDLHCGTLLVLLQKGFDGSVMSEYLFLLRLYKQCPWKPPQLEPEEVDPLCAMDNTGFCFTQLESSVSKKAC